jgi:HNH endonuclease
MSAKTIVTCETCDQRFLAHDSELRRGRGKYCSPACYHATTPCRNADRARIDRRFWERVNKFGPIPPHCPELGECWIWKGALNEWGYGHFSIVGIVGKAHRVAWFLEHGRWPTPCALHHCDNPACVRIDHLFEGDDAANMADRDAKGRNAQPHGEQNGQAKLTRQLVLEIRASGKPQRKLAKRYGVAKSTIAAVLHRRSWREV